MARIPADHKRKPKSKAKDNNDFVITDLNPSYCRYPNPPGMQYVEAETTNAKGETETALHCLHIDQIKRIQESQK